MRGYLPNYYHNMYALLVGDKGAYQLFHEREARSDLCHILQELDDGHCVISLETQQKATQFLVKYGTRLTRAYAKSLRRGVAEKGI